ncbi:MAG TPA: TonB-dependent receptor [Ignavibacteriales bacterium]|nr:TonB-dependent receptor [Ignavibacteriales bacterium]
MRKIILISVILIGNIFGGVTGKIVGKVVDGVTKEPLPYVRITVMQNFSDLSLEEMMNIDVSKAKTYTAITDKDGKFVILNISPGKYNVKANLIGYKTAVYDEIQIYVDLTTRVDFEMMPTSIQTSEVLVVAKRPAIQKDMTSSISRVSSEEISSLPVTSFTDILSIQAGVSGSGGNIHIRGGRSGEVAFMIDGMYVQDPLTGSLSADVSKDAIQELTLLSGTFNAEYGNAMSGVVNIVTKDGPEIFTGKVDYKTSEFGIKKYADYHQRRLSVSFGGPLIPNFLKLFSTIENEDRGSYLPFGFSHNQTAFAKFSFAPLSTSFGNLKFSTSQRVNWFKRQSYDHQWKYIPEMYSISRGWSYQPMLNLTHTITNNIFYDLRISYFTQGYFNGVDKDTSEIIARNQRIYDETKGNGTEFWKYAHPLTRTDDRTSTLDIKYDLVWQIDEYNEVKTGLQTKKHWLKRFSIDGIKDPINQQYVDDYRADEPIEFAAYLQDKIELGYLILNLGLRYDYLNTNVVVRRNPLDPTSTFKVKPRTQLSPRIGIAHPISENTKLHFSYGHFFQNPDYQYIYENKEYKVSVREPSFGSPDLDAQRTIAYEVGIDHQFNNGSLISFAAYYKDITGLIGTMYYPAYMRPGQYVPYFLYVNGDYANVKGFEISYDIKFNKYFSTDINYTYSVAKGNASSVEFTTVKPTNLYYLSFDQTHIFNVSTLFLIPKNSGPTVFGSKIFSDMGFNFIMKLASGYPYTPGGRDAGFQIPNSLRMPMRFNLDIIVDKMIELPYRTKLKLYVELLNATNYKNVLYVYPDTGEPDVTFMYPFASVDYIKDPSNYGEPRYIRIGASLQF